MKTSEKMNNAIRPFNISRFLEKDSYKIIEKLNSGRAEKSIESMTDDITKFVVALQYHLEASIAYRTPFAFRNFSFFPYGSTVEVLQNNKSIGRLNIESVIRRVVENTDIGHEIQ